MKPALYAAKAALPLVAMMLALFAGRAAQASRASSQAACRTACGIRVIVAEARCQLECGIKLGRTAYTASRRKHAFLHYRGGRECWTAGIWTKGGLKQKCIKVNHKPRIGKNFPYYGLTDTLGIVRLQILRHKFFRYRRVYLVCRP